MHPRIHMPKWHGEIDHTWEQFVGQPAQTYLKKPGYKELQLVIINRLNTPT